MSWCLQTHAGPRCPDVSCVFPLPGAKAHVSMQAGEGGSEQERGQGEPVCGAAAVYKTENQEFGKEGLAATGAVAPLNQGYLEEAGASGGGPDTQPAGQQISVVMRRPGDVQPVPVLVSRRSLRDNFNLWQLQELERIFQCSHYISPAKRRHLARLMGVTESKVQ
ncbi:rhox homeobox family member 2-like, partial [Nannospalax galili]|uniref:rhox homeobox family member 2-like n=1 Tax=Nannospalax galili TaxID=1026970 RepID=UPI0004ED6F42